MSIYISGVEMPKEHPLYITLRPDESVHVWDSYDGDSYKAQAIYVPDHGRLKDYDAIYAEYKTWFDNAEYRDYKSMFFALWNAFNFARVIISADKKGKG